MAGADGQTRHQCLADDALDEAEAVTQTGQYRGGEDGSCSVAAMWARREHEKVRADRSPVRADSFCFHIWTGNESTVPRAICLGSAH
jgi:hypothetical protein